jgi:hypothetical protein
MSWFRTPVKLFSYSGVAFILIRLIAPPGDFAGAVHLHSYVRLFDWKLDLTGYGLFEFAGLVFLFSALTYYVLFRLTGHFPNPAMVQLHFWPTLLFGICSIFLAHWVNQFPKEKFDDPTFQPFLNRLLLGFSWVFIAFLTFQLAFAIGVGKQIWGSRNTAPSTDVTANS